VKDLFEAQVRRTPELPALSYERTEMSYEELNCRANQVGHYLRKRGVGPEVPVGLYMKRVPDMLVAMLGIIKAGGAYVPLDLGFPRERLEFILHDTRAPLVVTDGSVAGRLPADAVTLRLDVDWSEIGSEPSSNPRAVTLPSGLACVLYTSGSSGQPKGVMIPHQSLGHYTAVAAREFELEARDRVLQFASIAFDSSLEEIFPTLTTGATLVLRNEQMIESFGTFLQEADKLQLTVLDLPTGYFHELSARLDDDGGPNIPHSLRLLILGGEKAHADRVRTWQRHAGPRVRLLNTYGPTEATVVATMCDISPKLQPESEIPIGNAIPGAEIHVLDRKMRPVPAGDAGELCIGGLGVARGYLNRRELTSANFVPDPFSPEPGSRLYKTGDIVRRRSDGSLLFLGRLDHQVKIRGFRVELGDVGALLEGHPSVRQCVVKVHEEPGDRRLVAYLVPRTAAVPTAGEMRRFLQSRAPDYMIPGTFVWLERFPLTHSGKVDRAAMPPPPRVRPELERPLVAPRDRVEHQLKEIWEEILKVQPVSVLDNFFELGGHSLLVIDFCERVARRLGKDLSPATVLLNPTIERLAAILRRETETPQWSFLMPFQPRGFRTPFFCVSGNEALAGHMPPDQPFYGLQLHGQDGRRIPSTVEAMAADLLGEIRSLQSEGPYRIGGFSFGATVAFEIACQLRESGQAVALLALLDPDRLSEDQSFPSTNSSFNDGGAEKVPRARAKNGGSLSDHLARRTLGNARSMAKKVTWLTWLGLGLRLPASLRKGYLLDTRRRAARRYVPQPHGGIVVLLHSETRSPALVYEWRKVACREFNVHEIPGGHMDLLREPNVSAVAALLGRYLADEPARQADGTRPAMREVV
jgi:amino acid adenylation domain-containing protein